MVLPPSGTNGYRFDDKGEKVYDYVDGRTIDNPKVAKALLPTQEGFFFGSQDYDQWYLEDLEENSGRPKNGTSNRYGHRPLRRSGRRHHWRCRR
jgi:hypothetical protein